MNELTVPNHVGIIMDGNGRWATKRGLSRSLGHKKGADNLKKLLKHIYKRGVKYVSVYAFSTENFKRPKEEVNYLMDLFIKIFVKESHIFVDEGIKVIFSGCKDNLREDILVAMRDFENKTKDLTNGVFNVCLNYGGRREIVDSFKKILDLYKSGSIEDEDINENLITDNLYQKLPPLDLVIRTSGEYRISNFMLWQSSYAEYYFTDVLFPDFNNDEFDLALSDYSNRKRRYGGL